MSTTLNKIKVSSSKHTNNAMITTQRAIPTLKKAKDPTNQGPVPKLNLQGIQLEPVLKVEPTQKLNTDRPMVQPEQNLEQPKE